MKPEESPKNFLQRRFLDRISQAGGMSLKSFEPLKQNPLEMIDKIKNDMEKLLGDRPEPDLITRINMEKKFEEEMRKSREKEKNPMYQHIRMMPYGLREYFERTLL